jgi:hypothetical protein
VEKLKKGMYMIYLHDAGSTQYIVQVWGMQMTSPARPNGTQVNSSHCLCQSSTHKHMGIKHGMLKTRANLPFLYAVALKPKSMMEKFIKQISQQGDGPQMQ